MNPSQTDRCNSGKRISIIVLVAVLISGSIGVGSYFTVTSAKKSLDPISDGILVSLEPIQSEFSDPETGEFASSGIEGAFGIWKFAVNATSEEEFLDEIFSIPESHQLVEASVDSYPEQPSSLLNPLLSRKSGAFPKSMFPFSLEITNPNDPLTWLMVSVNGGRYEEFEEQSIQINPGDQVRVYVRGDTRRWNESDVVTGRYIVSYNDRRIPR